MSVNSVKLGLNQSKLKCVTVYVSYEYSWEQSKIEANFESN